MLGWGSGRRVGDGGLCSVRVGACWVGAALGCLMLMMVVGGAGVERSAGAGGGG